MWRARVWSPSRASFQDGCFTWASQLAGERVVKESGAKKENPQLGRARENGFC